VPYDAPSAAPYDAPSATPDWGRGLSERPAGFTEHRAPEHEGGFHAFDLDAEWDERSDDGQRDPRDP
jgi:hypothetical protein